VPAPGGTAVVQIDKAGGAVNSFAALHGAWGIAQVANDGSTGGLSADGTTLVLSRTTQTFFPARSRFALVNPVKMRLQRVVTLQGAFYFDAISPDGGTMYLIELTSPRNVLHYVVRAYDLRHDRLVPGAIVDKSEPDERMAGFPIARATSGDGVWAYTLYQKPRGALFVHALNTQAGLAHCIDLPTLPDAATGVVRLSLDGSRLDVLLAGQVYAAVDRTTFAVTRAPATAVASTAPAEGNAPVRRSSGRSPIWIAAPAGLLAIGVAAFAVRRRRPARGGRSGGAAAGAPSGP
jgi:hypothetical protein